MDLYNKRVFDLELVQLETREDQALSGAVSLVGALVAIGALIYFGLVITSNVETATDPMSGGDYINSSYYCDTGSWNGSTCIGGTRTAMEEWRLAHYNTFNQVQPNIDSGFKLASILPLVAVAAVMITALVSLSG